ncbi:MAG: T9SS type A sorting domain-containing protein [Bacteroidetes bacterium]|nr:T9SS type A sorting domain-containing protein [Bacteroidota bacterium]
MKRFVTILIIHLFVQCIVVNGQECLSSGCMDGFTNQYPSNTFSTSSSSWSTVSAYMNAGNWTTFNVTNGYTYEWSYCESYGGVSTNWDAQLTLFEYNNPPTANFLCFSDDYCGSTGLAPYISWTANFSGTVCLLTTQYSCASNTGSPYDKLVWRCSSTGGCTNWYTDPITQSVPATGGSYQATVYATGSCTYNLTFPDNWIVFDNYGTGGQFNYHVTNNTSGNAQTGHIYVNDVTGGVNNVASLVINQDGAQTGSVTVAILPAAVVSSATWSIDGNGNYSSGYTQNNVPIGSHSISFSNVSGWTTPANQNINVTVGNNSTLTGTYVQTSSYGSVMATILPSAVSGSATWSIDGIGNYSSGTTQSNVTTGNHFIGFSNMTGWISPSNQNINVTAGNTSYVSGTYTQSVTTGAINVTIVPVAAQVAGAMWNIDGLGGYLSGITVPNIPTGNHSVGFTTVNDWLTPSNQNVIVIAGNTSTTSGVYLSTGIPYEGNNDLIGHLLIYPNPSDDKLFIEFKGSNRLQKGTISIYNIAGKLTIQLSYLSSITEVNVSDLPRGYYFLKVENSHGIVVGRFVKD